MAPGRSWARRSRRRRTSPRRCRRRYGERADEVLKVYAGDDSDEVLQAATDLASDRFIAFSTWKWFDLHGQDRRQAGLPLLYARPRPA